MPDSNHNLKNYQGRMVSGTSAASIVNFVVDPWMLKMTDVANELYHIEYWAGDYSVLCLATSKTVLKMLGCKFNDVENCASLILSLTFISLWSFSINARELGWQDRCV